jgi:hypothetical protein
MAVVGTAFFQMWAEATGSFIESLSFSMENLPGLDATGVISMNTVSPQLDPNSLSGPPEAAAFLIDWFTADGGFAEADPVFWGAFFSPRLVRVDFGVTCIQMKGKWTLALELSD